MLNLYWPIVVFTRASSILLLRTTCSPGLGETRVTFSIIPLAKHWPQILLAVPAAFRRHQETQKDTADNIRMSPDAVRKVFESRVRPCWGNPSNHLQAETSRPWRLMCFEETFRRVSVGIINWFYLGKMTLRLLAAFFVKTIRTQL